MQGRQQDRITIVPRYAVHNTNEIWTVNEDKLHIQPVQVIRWDRDNAYITEGIDTETVIVTSPLDTVVDGMRIRTNGQTQP